MSELQGFYKGVKPSDLGESSILMFVLNLIFVLNLRLKNCLLKSLSDQVGIKSYRANKHRIVSKCSESEHGKTREGVDKKA